MAQGSLHCGPAFGPHFVLNSAVRPTEPNLINPPLLYGTAWKQDDTARLVNEAIGQGFRAIDTACQPRHYNEAGVGQGVAASLQNGLKRNDLHLQTKFTPLSGQDPKRLPYDRNAPLDEQLRQSFEVSLRNLRTDYVDSLLLHSPLSRTQDTLMVWQGFEQLVDAGRVRQLGLSNCYRLAELESLCSAVRIKPAFLQNRFHAATHYDRAIRAFCSSQQIVYQSFWTLTANAHLLAHATIRDVSARYQRTAAQILFRYLTQLGIMPLTGTQSLAHMREDLAIFEFELDADACRAMALLF